MQQVQGGDDPQVGQVLPHRMRQADRQARTPASADTAVTRPRLRAPLVQQADVTIKRWASKRDEKEPPIVDALRAAGALVERLDYPCDLLVRFRGRHYLLEVEGVNPYRKRAKKQLDFIREWQVPLVKTPEQALAAIGATA